MNPNNDSAEFELQSSRSVHPNRNDEPDLMAATRASGACSGIELISSKIHQKQKEKRGGRGRQPPAEGGQAAARAGGARGGSIFRLQDVLLFLLRVTFIEIISWGVFLVNYPGRAAPSSEILILKNVTPH